MQHLPSPHHQPAKPRGRIFRWLSRWGRRLWRSCCYPFRALVSKRFPGPALNQSGSAPSENLESRHLPSSRSEAIRQRVLSPPDTEPAVPPATTQQPVPYPNDQPDAAQPQVSEETSKKVFSQTAKPPSVAPQSVIADLPVSWVLQQRLAIGPMPKKSWALGLQNQGVRVVLSLCDEAEGKLPKAIAQQFRCLRVPLPDSRYRRVLTLDELEEAVDLIHWHVQKQQPVYLHCLAGIERSPLVAIAYLCRYRAMDLLDAVNWLSHVHGRSRPLPAQLQVVREYLQRR